jgi:hypothetical protein
VGEIAHKNKPPNIESQSMGPGKFDFENLLHDEEGAFTGPDENIVKLRS